MKPIKKSFQHSLENGINNPTYNSKDLLTPREKWQKKEKELKIKYTILFLLSHFIWPAYLSLGSSTPIKIPIALKEKDHQMIQIPARVFTTIPTTGEKIPITVTYKNTILFPKAFLHKVTEGTLPHSEKVATIEIPDKDLSKLKTMSHMTVDILPPIKISNGLIKQHIKRGPYEITI